MTRLLRRAVALTALAVAATPCLPAFGYDPELPDVIVTVAGSGDYERSGSGGPAREAGVADPNSIAVGPDGAIYVIESRRDQIRVVTPDGGIDVFAGTGKQGCSGDGGPARKATFSDPAAVRPRARPKATHRTGDLRRR